MPKIDDTAYVEAAEWDNAAEFQAWLDNLDDWFTELEAAMENTVSRDGTTPNTMADDLLCGDNNILNGTIVESA